MCSFTTRLPTGGKACSVWCLDAQRLMPGCTPFDVQTDARWCPFENCDNIGWKEVRQQTFLKASFLMSEYAIYGCQICHLPCLTKAFGVRRDIACGMRCLTITHVDSADSGTLFVSSWISKCYHQDNESMYKRFCIKEKSGIKCCLIPLLCVLQ